MGTDSRHLWKPSWISGFSSETTIIRNNNHLCFLWCTLACNKPLWTSGSRQSFSGSSAPRSTHNRADLSVSRCHQAVLALQQECGACRWPILIGIYEKSHHNRNSRVFHKLSWTRRSFLKKPQSLHLLLSLTSATFNEPGTWPKQASFHQPVSVQTCCDKCYLAVTLKSKTWPNRMLTFFLCLSSDKAKREVLTLKSATIRPG